MGIVYNCFSCATREFKMCLTISGYISVLGGLYFLKTHTKLKNVVFICSVPWQGTFATLGMVTFLFFGGE